jgi:hypothetical protein
VKARCGWQRDDLGCDKDEPNSVMGGITLKMKVAYMCSDKQHEQDRKIASLGVEIDPLEESASRN